MLHCRGDLDKTRAVTALAVSSQGGLNDTATNLAVVGRASGAMECINPSTGSMLWSVPPSSTPKDAIEGLHICYQGPACSSTDPVVISVAASGCARIHSAPQDGSGEAELRHSWSVPATVCCSAFEEATARLAIGSQGAELRIFDAASREQPIFAAKGGKPNMVGLVDKPWNSAVAFVPGSNGTKVLCGTGYHKFRLYDTTVGKRPQLDVSFGETRITAVAPEADGRRCWVANGLGQIEVYDFRAGKFAGGIKGVSGSVRSLAVLPGSNVVASGGLDRFLRLHDTTTRKSLGKVYLKTQITEVAFCPTDESMVPAPAAGEEAQVVGHAEVRETVAAAGKKRGRGHANGEGARKR